VPTLIATQSVLARRFGPPGEGPPHPVALPIACRFIGQEIHLRMGKPIFDSLTELFDRKLAATMPKPMPFAAGNKPVVSLPAPGKHAAAPVQ